MVFYIYFFVIKNPAGTRTPWDDDKGDCMFSYPFISDTRMFIHILPQMYLGREDYLDTALMLVI
jgi:hypothetical protein